MGFWDRHFPCDLSGGTHPYEGVFKKGSHIDERCCKDGCARQCVSVFCEHTGNLGLKVLGEVWLAMRARVSKTVRALVKPAVFPHTSFAIVGDTAKEQHQLAMCRR